MMNTEEPTTITATATVSKDEWIKVIKDNQINNISDLGRERYNDFEGVDYLSPIIEGYMTSPVAVHNGKHIEAKTRKFDDISDALNYCINLNARIIIYTLLFFPGRPVYATIDENTFIPVPLDKPYVSSSYWLIRYATA